MAKQMASLTLEEWMILNMNQAIAIAGRTTRGARMSLSIEADLHLVIDSCRDCYFTIDGFF
jgi:hypothetical protein